MDCVQCGKELWKVQMLHEPMDGDNVSMLYDFFSCKNLECPNYKLLQVEK